MHSNVRISLVIPVYNEENHLAACLDAIAAQSFKPYEVLVVDNNSTDKTVAIARAYPFVTVLTAEKQGVVHARQVGFDAACGDIIGRIDADTLVPVDWTLRLAEAFADPAVAAVSGAVHYHDAPLARIADAIDLRCRKWLARTLGNYVYLLGCNMGIRKNAWLAVREHVCDHGWMHEDLDLAAHLGQLGQRVLFYAPLRANISGRRVQSGVMDFYYYVALNSGTYARHQIRERRYMYPVMALALIAYVPMRLLYRAYDQQTGRLSVHTFRTARVATARVSPATFID